MAVQLTDSRFLDIAATRVRERSHASQISDQLQSQPPCQPEDSRAHVTALETEARDVVSVFNSHLIS